MKDFVLLKLYLILHKYFFAFKQEEEEPLVKTWERFRGIAFGMEHGLRDWMLMHILPPSINKCLKFVKKEMYLDGGSIL